jgi:transglutaminase-like putative cysteine protease
MLVMLPLQWTLVIDQMVSLEEQFMSVGGRLFFSLGDFFARRPVDDPFFFVAVMTVAFWVMSTSAGFNLVRRQNYLAAVVPSAIGLIVIQSYDNSVEGRVWILAFFAFTALLLLGRLNHLENKKSWHDRRVFLSPDNSLDLTSTMAVAAGLIILVAWTTPASLSSLDSAVRTWNKVTRPWRAFTERMENAVSALESPSGGKRGEFYGSELMLGRGFPLSDLVMFTVQVPDLPSEERPPRYYWRGRTYDYFVRGQWYTTGTSFVDYSPADIIPVLAEEKAPANFIFNTGETAFSLIYAPAQPVWVSRPGVTLSAPTNAGGQEVVSWFATPTLLAGEAYQVNAVLNNPNQGQLREAGTDYPEWVKQKYLQLPDDFSPLISELALEITSEAETPYDKTVAITQYLRENITYASTIPQPPRNTDILEWILFEYKQGYCVYYATSEVLMLRSLGIPARMAVGFSQGERDSDTFVVRRFDAHAWPEVYFPGVGWTEFEPTGSQPTLSRPLPPRDPSETNDPVNPLDTLRSEDGLNFAGRDQPLEEGLDPTLQTDAPLNPSLYLIPLFIIFATLTIYFSRRYAIPARIPVLLRTSIERSGSQAPHWIINWERWVDLSPIEKSFESINFGLRILENPAPRHATPIERAKALSTLLPKTENQIKTLLDEHQTSLYTSRNADAIRARRAAFNIRIQVLIEKVRYMLKGKPIRNT